MANKEQYLNALLNAKNNAIQTNGVLVNPNNTSTQVGNVEQGTVQPTNVNANSQSAWYEKVFGFIDDVAREFGSGFVRGWEGMGDFVLTGVSAIGEAMGQDMTKLNDYIKLDLGGLAGNWTQSYMNFTPWGIFNNIKNYSDSEYWSNMGQDTIANLDMAFGGFGGHNQEDINKIIENNQKYAINNASTLTDMGKSGEFIGGIAGSIGQMLPSIMIGNAVGAKVASAKGFDTIKNMAEMAEKGDKLAKGLMTGVKTAQLGSFGLGAGGQGSQEALNEGASAGKALAYGTVVGSIEVATELGSDLMAKGAGKLVGNLVEKYPKANVLKSVKELVGKSNIGGFDITRKVLGMSSISDIAKNMIEEGIEEVESELLSPLAKSIYKGKEAFKEYKTNEYWQGVATSFASGAVMGGVMDGFQQTALSVSLGKEGVSIVRQSQEASAELGEIQKKLNKGQITQEQAEKMAEKPAKALKELAEKIANLDAKHQENLVKLYADPESLIKQLDKEYKSTQLIKELYKSGELTMEDALNLGKGLNYKDISKMSSEQQKALAMQRFIDDFTYYDGFDNRIKDSEAKMSDVLGKDFTVRYEGNIKDNGYYDPSRNEIVINEKNKDTAHAVLAHEGIVHALHNASPEALDQIWKYLTETEKGKKLYEKVMAKTKTVHNEDLKKYGYKNLEDFIDRAYKPEPIGSAKYETRAYRGKQYYDRVIKEEKLAHFMQEMVNNYDDFADIMEGNKGRGVITRILDKITARFDKTGVKELYEQFRQVVDTIKNGNMTQNNVSGEVKQSLKPNTTREGYTINNHRISSEYYERQNAYMANNVGVGKYNVITWNENALKEIQSNQDLKSVILEGMDYSFYIGKYHLHNFYPTKLNLNGLARGVSVPTLKTILFNVAKGKPQAIFYNGNYESYVKVYTDRPAPKINGEKSVWVLNFKNVGTNTKSIYKKAVQEITLSIATQKEAELMANPISFEGKNYYVGLVNVKNKRFVGFKTYKVGKSLTEYFDEETNEKIKNKEYARFIVNPSTNKLEFTIGATRDKVTNEGVLYKDDKGIWESVRRRLGISKDAIRRSKSVDSEGNLLTKYQVEWHKDNKFVDDEGRPIVLYHGTTHAGFTIFNNSIYHASGEEYSNIYVSWAMDRIKDGSDNYSGLSKRVLGTKEIEHIQEVNKKFDDVRKQLSKETDPDKFIKLFNENIPLFKEALAQQMSNATPSSVYIEKIFDDDGLYEYNILGNNRYADGFAQLKKMVMQQLKPDYDEKNFGNYKIYMKSTNPLVIDCKKQSWDDLNLKNTGNETLDKFFKFMKGSGELVLTQDIVNMVVEKMPDIDGVIFKNIYDGTDKPANVYVTIRRQNQIKLVDNLHPTADPDIRYSKAVDLSSYAKNENGFIELNNEQVGQVVGEMIKTKSEIETSIFDWEGHKVVLYNNFIDLGQFTPKTEKNVIKQFLLKTFRNADIYTKDGMKVGVSGRGASKIANNITNNQHEISLYSENLIQIAEYLATEKDTKGRKGVFDYYTSYIRFGNDIFKVKLNIFKDQNGNNLYDINGIENVEKKEEGTRKLAYYGGSSSTNNISQDNSVVKTEVKKSKSVYDIEDDFFDWEDLDEIELEDDFDTSYATTIRETSSWEEYQQKLEEERKAKRREYQRKYQKEYRKYRKAFDFANKNKQAQFDVDVSKLTTFEQQQEYRNSGKSATFTKERIEELLKEYGSLTSLDYSNAFVTEISPREFLEVTPPMPQNYRAGEVDSNIDIEKFKSVETRSFEFPRLETDGTLTQITQHNSRHRMYALMKNGYTKVQILVLPIGMGEGKYKTTKKVVSLKPQIDNIHYEYDKETGNQKIILGARNFKTSAYNVQLELTPLSQRYSKELFENAKKEAEIKYSKSVENKTSYINYATTQDIVKDFESELKYYFGDDVRISYPKGLKNFEGKAFTAINAVKSEELEGRNLAELFLQTSVRYKNEEGLEVGKLSIRDLLTPEEQDSLRSAITNIIRTKEKTPARDDAVRQLKVSLERLQVVSDEYKNMLKPSMNIIAYTIQAKEEIGKNYQITKDAVERDGFKFLMKPFAVIKRKGGKFSVKGLEASIREVLAEYTEKNYNGEDSPIDFYPEIVEMYQDLLDTIGEPQTQQVHHKGGNVTERDVYGYLNSEQLTIMDNLIHAIDHLIKHSTEKRVKETRPISMATYKSVLENKYGVKTDIASQWLRKWKRGFAPSYVVVREITGASRLSELITTEGQNALNKKVMYNGRLSDEINEKLKQLNIKKDISKKITINGVEMTTQQALYLYLSTQIQANRDEIAKNGAIFYDKNGRPVELIGKGVKNNDGSYSNDTLDAFEQDLDKKLSNSMKEFGDFILDKFNTQFKQDYINWYEDTYGRFNGRNEIGKVGERTYFPLYRYVARETSVEMMARIAGGIFTNAKRRFNNTHPVAIGDVLSTMETYAERLSNEMYVKPVYRQIVSTLNQKVENGKTLKEVIKEKTDPQDLAYLTRTLKSFVGVDTENRSTPLDAIMSNYAIAKLSLNIGSALKQYASIWTSNLPLSVSTKAFFQRVFGNSAYKSLFNELVETIGGLKYRKSGSAVINANAGTVKGVMKDVSKVTMGMLTSEDYFTISVGVYGLMGIGANELKADISTPQGKEAIKKFVVENWSEFELSQIGSGALSQSAISRGDYDGIVKAVFGFLQGANRASFGSQINKMDTWDRNRKLNKADIKKALEEATQSQKNAQQEYEEAQKNLEEARENYFKGGRTQELREEYSNAKAEFAEAEAKYIQANADLEYAQNRDTDYKRYERMGGKRIPMNMVAGLMAQGVFVALISELMKHIKGKRDWDDWAIKEMGTNTLLAICADWIPLVNTFSSLIQGYETSVPTTELLNQIASVAQSLQNKNWRVAIKQVALAVGDMTGLPFQTVYQYIYGTIKAFDPETAWKLNSLFYNATESGANSALRTYANKNSAKGTTAMISVLMNNYKTTSDDEINKELSSLYLSGYRALPSSYMTSYTNEKGEEVNLNAQQIAQFRETYNTSYSDIKDLLALGEYQYKTQEQKAKTIKSLYNAYYENAKARTTNIVPSSKMGKMLYYSNGNIRLAKLVSTVNSVSQITDNKKKSKKELTIEYINKQRTLSKAEKVLAMYLCGYSVGESNKQLLKSYFMKMGMSNKIAKELLD